MLNMLIYGGNIPVSVLELYIVRVAYMMVGKYGTFLCHTFIENMKKLALIKQSQILSCFMKLQTYRLVVNL